MIPMCNSADKDLPGKEIMVPDYDDTDMSKLLAGYDKIFNQLQNERSNHSSKIADLTHKVISFKSSADKDLVDEEVVVPDHDDTNMLKLLSGHDVLFNQLQNNRSKHSSKIADLNHQVISVKTHLNNASQQVKMMSTGTKTYARC
jgi:septal ring factor EnvC (AmiA/AmiB activator)